MNFIRSAFLVAFMLGSACAFFSGGGGGMSMSMGGLGSMFGKGQEAGYVRTKAFIQESPEIGLGFKKIPISIPIPTLILRKTKSLVTRGQQYQMCGGGCGGGHGGGGGGY